MRKMKLKQCDICLAIFERNKSFDKCPNCGNGTLFLMDDEDEAKSEEE